MEPTSVAADEVMMELAEEIKNLHIAIAALKVQNRKLNEHITKMTPPTSE